MHQHASTFLGSTALLVSRALLLSSNAQAAFVSGTRSIFARHYETNLHSTKKPALGNEHLLQQDTAEDFEERMVEELLQIDPITINEEAMMMEAFREQEESSPVIDTEFEVSPVSEEEDDEEKMGDEALRLLSSELGVKKLIGDDSVPFPLPLIWERTLDTVEDVMLHLKRVPYDLGWQPDESFLGEQRRTVVVLGSGWAAHALLKVADNFKLRVIVVSPSNHFVFTPMLASAAVGTVEYRSMTEAVRAANPMIEQYVEGMATDVDLEKKVVKVQLNSLLETLAEGDPPCLEIPYDNLVVSVGAKVADANVPGAAERCLRLKSCDDARHLRESIGECFEYASRPDVSGDTEEQEVERSRRVTFLIVGGGPTGVELAGELTDLAKDITKPRVGAYPRLKDSVKVILVHGGNQVLQQFEGNLRDEALKTLQKQGVDVRLNTKVTEVGDGFVNLSVKKLDKDGNEVGRGEERLPVGVTVWCAGTAPVPFVDTLLQKLPESARGQGGRINVDKWLRPDTGNPETFGSVLVLGDAAAFEERKDSNSFLPQTAQVAGQQGAYVARLLCREYNLNTTPPVLGKEADSTLSQWLKLRGLEVAPGFGFLNLGLLAYLGGGEALSQVQIGDVPIFSYAGSVAFILWRSVYLVKQVATRNRVLVTFDWLKSTLFGRDVTRL